MKDQKRVIGVIPQYPTHSQQNVFSRVRMPPLGVISILSQIADSYDVYAIDENNYGGPLDFHKRPDHRFLQKKHPADIAMFYGGMTNAVLRLYALAKRYQEKGVLTIAGGSHVDALPEEAVKAGVDIVVHGEGEKTVERILDVLDSRDALPSCEDQLRNIRGISFLSVDGSYVYTGDPKPLSDLDALRDIDLTLVKYLEKRWSAIPLHRGRGCNFNCEFCVVNTQYGAYKRCCTDTVMRQIIRYSDMGYRAFFFTDDNFAMDRASTIRLCRQIGDYKRRFRKKLELTVQVRSEMADDDVLIDAMRYAGVNRLAIGFESPIKEDLIAMRKGVTVEKMLERSRKLSDFFYIHGMFLFGYPSFSDSRYVSPLTLKEKAKRYMWFFRKARIDTVQVFNTVPLPGSELRRKLEAEGRVFPKEMVNWDKYDGQFLCYDPSPEGIDPRELQHLPRLLMKRKYLGNPLLSRINYGNWLQWSYYATVGFPLQFSWFYITRLISDLRNRRREYFVSSGKNVFERALRRTWGDIRRKWSNLAIRTVGGAIVRKWMREYRKLRFGETLRRLYAHYMR